MVHGIECDEVVSFHFCRTDLLRLGESGHISRHLAFCQGSEAVIGITDNKERTGDDLSLSVSSVAGQPHVFGILVVDEEGTVAIVQIVDPFPGNGSLFRFQIVEDFCNIGRSAGFHINDGQKIVGLLGLGFIESDSGEAKAVTVEGTVIGDNNVGHLHLTATVQGVTDGVELGVECLQTVEVHLSTEHLVIERCLNTGTALAAFQIGEPFVPHSVDIPVGIDLVDFDSHSAHLPQGL